LTIVLVTLDQANLQTVSFILYISTAKKSKKKEHLSALSNCYEQSLH